MNYIYELEMKVRDYECDLQGIVNNANYQHYLEHTRLNSGFHYYFIIILTEDILIKHIFDTFLFHI